MSEKIRQSDGKSDRKRDGKGLIALLLTGLVATMVGLSFAAVPLYRMFCQVTGYGGTTQVAQTAPAEALARTMTVHFDANVDKKLPWTFAPDARTMEVHIGESALTFFRAHNNTDRPVTGTAGFNVVPASAGKYFAKIECFCFKKQTLGPGQTVEMPVTFFVDPRIVEDENTRNIEEITLSYTFYRSEGPPDVAAAGKARASGS